MSGYWVDKGISYWYGSIVDQSTAVFILGMDSMVEQKVPHTVLAFWAEGGWDAEYIEWTAADLCFSQKTNFTVIVGVEGQSITISKDRNIEVLPEIPCFTRKLKEGEIRRVRQIDGDVYAVGMSRQVYRLYANNWQEYDLGIPGREGYSCGFEDIAGTSENNIYAVGWSGEIWHKSLNNWQKIESITNLILTSVAISPEGDVLVAGQAGTLILGGNNQWRVINQSLTEEDFSGVVWFDNKFYISSSNLLYCLDGTELVQVEFEEDIPFSFRSFEVVGELLYSIGQHDIMVFDKYEWQRFD